MNRPSRHLPVLYSLAMIALAVFLMLGFSGLWPEWLMSAWRAATATLMVAIMTFAVFIGVILAFILVVRPRR